MIFANSVPLNSTRYNQYEVTYDGLSAAIFESTCEWETFKGDEEVIMANMYENWILDTDHTAEEKQAVYEGVLADIWENIKKFFIAIANKIKSWILAVIKYFKTTFLSDTEFIKKYKDEIEERDDDDFTFEAHKWNLEAITKAKETSEGVLKDINKDRAEVKTLADLIGGKETEYDTGKKNESNQAITTHGGGRYQAGIDDGDDILNDKDRASYATKLRNADNTQNRLSEDELNKANAVTSSKTKALKKSIESKFSNLVRGVECSNKQKLQAGLAKLINGGEKKTCKTFSSGKSLSKEKMIEIVEDNDSSDLLEDIKTLADDIEQASKDTSDYVDTIVNSYTSKSTEHAKDKSKVSKLVRFYTDLAKHRLDLAIAVVKTCEEEYRSCIKECSSILRTFARHTSKSEKEAEKESYNRYRRGRSVSLLENWM